MAKSSTVNISRVMRLVWMNPGISRIDIARRLELDKSTITNIVSRLIEERIIVAREEGASSAKGGRKPIGLAIDDSYGCILGLEITTDRIMAAVIDLQGRTLFVKTINTAEEEDDLKGLFSLAIDGLSDQIEKTGLKLIGIGVGLSGLIDPDRGLIMRSIPLDIDTPYPFIEMIEPIVKLPVLIDNDANCCCWDEMVRSHRERYENFLFVLAESRTHSRIQKEARIGLAVGMGLVIHGKVLRGSDYSAGEFKSILWQDQNTNQFSVPDSFIADPQTYQEAIEKITSELASHVAFLVNFLDLSLVVLGGDLQQYGSKLIETFEREIRRNWSYPNQGNCEVSFVNDNQYAVALGAAGMFLERLFSVDILEEERSDSPCGYELFRSLG